MIDIYTSQKLTEPVEETINRVREKIIKPARLKNVDTGRKQIIKIVDKKGAETEELKTVYDRISLPAVVEDENYSVKVWVVYSVSNEMLERHEFNSLNGAQNFYKKG